MGELKQIETMSLRDYIDQEMTRLHQETMDIYELNEEQIFDNLGDIMSKASQLMALQEIAYRLEYGYITDIGTKSLKNI